MARVEILLPRMGESINEATLLQWTKAVGESIEAEETIAEVATDKVDTEVPVSVSGVVLELLYQPDDVIEVGKPIAIIDTASTAEAPESEQQDTKKEMENGDISIPPFVPEEVSNEPVSITSEVELHDTTSPTDDYRYSDGSFYSPLVRSIAKEEGISSEELKAIKGTGKDGKLTKKDVLDYLESKGSTLSAPAVSPTSSNTESVPMASQVVSSQSDRIVEMDRMRQMIAKNMVQSKQTSAHVTSFIETDVTNLVKWREENKDSFVERNGFKITYTPFIMEAVVKAIKKYPEINVQVSGDSIIYKSDINIGMATALPSGNLIVPVIKHADRKNIIGLGQEVNDLATRARDNALQPSEIQDGTFTITNLGLMGNDTGTPIILQPQVAILAVGAFKKKPAVVETEYGDLIAIRHMAILSMSYDHRVIDGYLGGMFLKEVADNLTHFTPPKL